MVACEGGKCYRANYSNYINLGSLRIALRFRRHSRLDQGDGEINANQKSSTARDA